MNKLITGLVICSFAPILVKFMALDPTFALFYRMLFGFLFVAGLLLVMRKPLLKRIYPLALLGGCIFSFDLWLWHQCIDLVGPGLATLLANCQVLFVTLYAVLVLKEERTRLQLMSTPFALLGLWLIFGVDSQNSGGFIGLIMGLGAALTYSIFILLLMKVEKQAQQDQVNSVQLMFQITAISVPFVALIVWYQGISLAFENQQSLGLLMVYGIVVQGIAWILISNGSKEIQAAKLTLILLLQPILAIVWDILIYNKQLHWYQTLGIVMTLAAIYIGSTKINLPKPQKKVRLRRQTSPL